MWVWPGSRAKVPGDTVIKIPAIRMRSSRFLNHTYGKSSTVCIILGLEFEAESQQRWSGGAPLHWMDITLTLQQLHSQYHSPHNEPAHWPSSILVTIKTPSLHSWAYWTSPGQPLGWKQGSQALSACGREVPPWWQGVHEDGRFGEHICPVCESCDSGAWKTASESASWLLLVAEPSAETESEIGTWLSAVRPRCIRMCNVVGGILLSSNGGYHLWCHSGVTPWEEWKLCSLLCDVVRNGWRNWPWSTPFAPDSWILQFLRSVPIFFSDAI